MKTFIVFSFLAIFLFSGCSERSSDAYTLSISKNTETLFIIYSIIDFGIFIPDESLTAKASKEFSDFKSHKAVEIVGNIARKHGIDALPHFLHHFSELPDFQLIYPLESNLKVNHCVTLYEDSLWITDEFVSAFRDFYCIANVEGFLQKYKTSYTKALKEVIKHLPSSNLIRKMESFYGIKSHSYVFYPSPVLFPTWGFAGQIFYDEKMIVFNTFGPQRFIGRSGGKSIIDFNSKEKIQNISVHEFGHSFVNPIANKPENRELINSYNHLFEPIKDELIKQGYTNWWICVVEHLVRLGEIRVSEALGNKTNAEMLRQNYTTNRRFIYLPLLERKIFEYENNRDKYPTYEEFFPELLNAFAEIQ